MKFQIPFTFARVDRLKKRTSFFLKFTKPNKSAKLKTYLEASEANLTREEYLAIVMQSFVMGFILIYLFSATLFVVLSVNNPHVLALGLAFMAAFFVSFSQLVYPKVFAMRKQVEIDKNLISALEDILVQLNSGIPLFSIMINISSSDYGELSQQFKKAVKKINAGYPQIEVLEELGEKNSSNFFRRTLWQLSNALKAGSDISQVIKDSIKFLNEEQLLQIQNYGNKLNPLVMFYMLISVIIPALGITFLTIISAMLNLSETFNILLFIGIFVFVFLIQVMFLGVIKANRPSLV